LLRRLRDARVPLLLRSGERAQSGPSQITSSARASQAITPDGQGRLVASGLQVLQLADVDGQAPSDRARPISIPTIIERNAEPRRTFLNAGELFSLAISASAKTPSPGV
jgi:hypothetical protein